MHRVVVTGMGVVAPNGITITDFNTALQQGISGLHHIPQLQEWAMGCQVAAYPKAYNREVLYPYLSAGVLKSLRSSCIAYALTAALEAWNQAGLPISKEQYLPHVGCIMGNSACDVDHMRYAIQECEELRGNQFGVRHIEQLMASGGSAYIGGVLGLGNRVTSNSSACSTGTESIIMAYEHIKLGNATMMVAGSSEASSPYMWSIFDAMRVCNRNHNHEPTKASRPMSIDSAGFIAGSGAAALVLETYDSAISRGATILAEITAGTINSGGQRNGGTMTAPSATSVVHCIRNTVQQAGIQPHNIDLICGHLTGTFADKLEIANWATALQLSPIHMPYINSAKGLIGHCISAAGSIECVAALLQLQHNYIHANANLTALQPEITAHVAPEKIPTSTLTKQLNTVIKANFGFGDVNSCIIFKKV